MRAVDTNVLIYAHDPRDTTKQEIAIALIESLTNGVLLWQVAYEYLSASHKLAALGYNREAAWQDIQDLRLVWRTILPTWQVQDTAADLLRWTRLQDNAQVRMRGPAAVMVAVVLLGVTVCRINRAGALSAIELLVAIVTALFFLGTIVTGGLLSIPIDKAMPVIVHKLHQVTPYLTVLSTATALYLLRGR